MAVFRVREQGTLSPQKRESRSGGMTDFCFDFAQQPVIEPMTERSRSQVEMNAAIGL